MVTQRSQVLTISPSAIVEILDPNDSALRGLREKVPMADGEKKARARRVYVRTEKEAKNMKGQGAVVLAALEHFGQATTAQIIEHTKGQYPTRQPEERVVGFYISKFKREGLIKDVTVDVAQDEQTEAQEREAAATEIEG